MKIMNQTKDYIAEFNKDMWTVQDNQGYSIIMRGTLRPVLGIYETQQRADEVFCELYRCYREGKQAYEMPQQ